MPFESTDFIQPLHVTPVVKRISLLVAVASLALVAGTGCGRALKSVSLEHLELKEPSHVIDVPIELCLPPALRNRQWNVAEHPFRLDLGSRASLNFERMVKRVFSDVDVTLSTACGSRTGLPWITARIVAANRELYTEVQDGVQHTSLRLDTEIRAPGGSRIWRSDQTAVIERAPALRGSGPFRSSESSEARDGLFSPFLGWAGTSVRHDRAAEDFGAALEQALRKTYEALQDHEALESALLEASQ